jgi:hypothetical protein
VTVCPAIVTVPIRAVEVVFAEIDSVTKPFPLPLPVVAAVAEIQFALLDAVQLHAASVDTVMVAVPASEACVTLVVDNVNEQGAPA